MLYEPIKKFFHHLIHSELGAEIITWILLLGSLALLVYLYIRVPYVQ